MIVLSIYLSFSLVWFRRNVVKLECYRRFGIDQENFSYTRGIVWNSFYCLVAPMIAIVNYQQLSLFTNPPSVLDYAREYSK